MYYDRLFVVDSINVITTVSSNKHMLSLVDYRVRDGRLAKTANQKIKLKKIDKKNKKFAIEIAEDNRQGWITCGNLFRFDNMIYCTTD